MKYLILLASSFLIFTLSSCDDLHCEEPICGVKATLVSKDFSCYGYGIRTEGGQNLVAVSNADEGHICPLALIADELEVGDEFYIEFEENSPGVVCMILPDEPFETAPDVWLTCFSIEDEYTILPASSK
ncbi:MAG: hypothetical protein AB8F95_13560 [Bacteroidia bacterium]